MGGNISAANADDQQGGRKVPKQGKEHKLTVIRRHIGTNRYQSVCSCGWTSKAAYSSFGDAWTAWTRTHKLPPGDTREDSPGPKNLDWG
jgi:hypothetical protein